MKRTPGTVAAIALAMLAVAVPAAGAQEQTREGYAAQVEPICERDKAAGEQILGGTKDNINEGKLTLAGRQLIEASSRFGATIRQLAAVPRPPADETKLQKWFKFLRIVKTRLGKTGKLYKEGKKLEATHESIRAEKSGNAANNVSFAFGFRECRLGRSRFS
ncbi:MAG TPA: hypothetical protein VNP96_08770 [Solirubrobacterales bacterium]|nr:hypothetical protein [Solirubrobacterales bacterium]